MRNRGGSHRDSCASQALNDPPEHRRSPSVREDKSKSHVVSCRTVAALFLYRVFIAFTLRTAESPDEWWQSAEVAYFMVFGKGHLSWEWKEGIRSVVFPSLYALPFFLLKCLHLDNAQTIYAAERLVQACIATGIDVTMVVLASRIDDAIRRDGAKEAAVNGHDDKEEARVHVRAGKRGGWFVSPSVAQMTVYLAMFQWYLTCDGARAYSNVAEGLFVALAVIEGSYVRFLLIAGVACMVRITAAIALFPIFLFHLQRQLRRRGPVRGLCYCLTGAALIVSFTIAAMMSIDYTFYGRWVLTPLKFLEFNIIKNLSQYFGVHPWWWYFAVGFPVIVGPHLLFLLLLPFVLWRLSSSGKERFRRTRAVIHRLVGLLVWTLLMHSSVPHKEVRFMFPMLPIALVLISFVIASVVREPRIMTFGVVRGRGRGVRECSLVSTRRLVCLHHVFLAVNVALIVFLGYMYRQGGVSVMSAVRNAPVPWFGRVDVLTHCYFTPGYSHLHGKVGELRLIDCPMELNSTTGKPRITDDILFRQFPSEFVHWLYSRTLPTPLRDGIASSPAFDQWLGEMKRRMPEDEPVVLPDGMVVFDSISDARSADLFVPNGYRRLNRVFHAPKSFEENEGSYVDLWVKESLLLRNG